MEQTRRLARLALLCALALPLGACGTTCGAFDPINPSAKDKLTDGTAKQILKHNLSGEATCGWKAPQ